MRDWTVLVGETLFLVGAGILTFCMPEDGLMIMFVAFCFMVLMEKL